MGEQLTIKGLEPSYQERLSRADIDLTQATETMQQDRRDYDGLVMARILLKNEGLLR